MDRRDRIGGRASNRIVTEPIRFHSTRDATTSISFSQALLQGLAPDGSHIMCTSRTQPEN